MALSSIPRHPAARRLLGALTLLATFSACEHAPTQPVTAPTPAPIARRNSAGGGSFTLPAPANNEGPYSGGTPWTGTGVQIPALTSYLVTVSGEITATSNPAATVCSGFPAPFGAEGSYGPWGGDFGFLRVVPGFQVSTGVFDLFWSSGAGSSTLTTDTLFAWQAGEIAVSRIGIAGAVSGPGDPPCAAGTYKLSGSQTVTVQTFDGQEIEVTPSAVVVRRGTPVTFTARSGGAVVAGPNWLFTGSGGAPNQTADCGFGGPNPCVVTVQNSGTMRVAKALDGRMRSAVATVRAYTAFTLEADRAQVSAGDTVRFTPRLDGTVGPAARWRWEAADGASATDPCLAIVAEVCQYAPGTSGTMWAYTAESGGDSASAAVTITPPARLTLLASASAVPSGTEVTFTAGADREPATVEVSTWRFVPTDTTLGTGCATAAGLTCRTPIAVSGSMWAYGSVDGRADSAAAAVQVIPLPDSTGCTALRLAPSKKLQGKRVPKGSLRTCTDSTGGGGDPTAPTLTVACTPHAPTRGTPVSCTASVANAARFVVTQRLAARRFHFELDTAGSLDQAEDKAIAHTGTEIDTWSGLAVAPTVVTYTVEAYAASGAMTILTDSARFDITPRSWQHWKFDETLAMHHVGDVLAIPNPPLPDFFGPTPTTPPGNSGLFLPRLRDSLTIPIDSVLTGPNRNLLYLRDEIKLLGYEIYIHPGLVHPMALPQSDPGYVDADQWYKKQRGGGFDATTHIPLCDAKGVDSIRALTEIHEGITRAPNSHWGDADTVFTNGNLHLLAEQYTDVMQPNIPPPGYVNHGREYVAWYVLQYLPFFSGSSGFAVGHD